MHDEQFASCSNQADESHTPLSGQGLMPRATITQLVQAKVKAHAAYLSAWDAMCDASALERFAAPSGVSGDLPWIGAGSRYGSGTISFETRDKYDAHVSRALDQNVWAHVIKSTNLDRLMDRKEREAFRKALNDDPPPATVDNIAATVERLLGDSDLIFKRGIALAFSSLDRRFRSHDGFKIGSRIVISYFADGNGYVRWDGRRDTVIDVERAFCLIDGKPQPGSDVAQGDDPPPISILDALASAKGLGWQASAYEAENEYFLARVFKNGNAHLWMKRKDLVGRVNQLLADYYGANLGVSPDAADVKHAPKTGLATSGPHGFGLFPSPEAVVAAIMHAAQLYRRQDVSNPERFEVKPMRVLEPSAGTGAIAAWAADCMGAEVVCVEYQKHLCVDLAASGRYRRVVNDDFLQRSPDDLGLFDVIVMNPPFDKGRDVDHVNHALTFLKPGGRLVSVMGAGVEFREDAKTVAFRAEIERRRGRFSDLPPASFAESGTNINTVLCTIGSRY
jgi:predicted RNA methylase